MKKKSNKVLIIVGQHSSFLYDVMDQLCETSLNFVSLETEKIFFSVLQSISKDYLSEEMDKAKKLMKKDFLHYLDLLYYSQKSYDGEVRKFYVGFYQKVQSLNKLILYRFYERLYFEALKIKKSGKNCVFVHNYFFSPYPARSEIFHDFFNLFSEDLKTLNVYTNMELSMDLLRENNKKFMDFVASKRSSYEAYKEIQNYQYDRQHLQNLYNPLVLLSSFTSMYNISSNLTNKYDLMECICDYKFKNIYVDACNETKNLFGYIIKESYPYFYFKAERLNQIKNSDVFLKDSKSKYIFTGKRIIYDYNLIFDRENKDTLLPKEFLDSLNAWLDDDKYIPYCQKLSNQEIRSCVKVTRISHQTYNSYPDNSVVTTQDNYNHIADISKTQVTDTILQNVIKRFLISSKEEFYLHSQDFFFITYTLEKKENGEIKLTYFSQNELAVNLYKDHLTLINLLYIKLLEEINKHFFIECIDVYGQKTNKLSIKPKMNKGLK
jgi:hypothetical protein